MGERATIYSVARRCGVSATTVSRVVRDQSFGSPATRERVLRVAAELGWVPNGAARGLASRRAGTVGLLFPNLSVSRDAEDESPLYLDEVIRGAERAAAEADQAVLIAAVRERPRLALAYSILSKVDGLVVLARTLPDRDIETIARSVPVVLLASVPTEARSEHASVDNRGGARELVRHLVEVHGYEDFAFIGGPPESPDASERFAGFKEALSAAGLQVARAPHARGGFTEAGGKEAVRSLLDSGRLARVLVCANDEMAVGVLSVLGEEGLRVPQDVAVTGFDDIGLARHLDPALTTVHQPMRELGERGVELLLARLEDPSSSPKSVLLPTRLVIRGSCGCGRSRDSRRPAHSHRATMQTEAETARTEADESARR
ncbi:MAG: LacI family DNA-binding transcriptional regulator [Actinomycetota bacterium]|nr:LacI family DNA-binding transcriptional regulator [Actinomycetota bacterium]